MCPSQDASHQAHPSHVVSLHPIIIQRGLWSRAGRASGGAEEPNTALKTMLVSLASARGPGVTTGYSACLNELFGGLVDAVVAEEDPRGLKNADEQNYHRGSVKLQ